MVWGEESAKAMALVLLLRRPGSVNGDGWWVMVAARQVTL